MAAHAADGGFGPPLIYGRGEVSPYELHLLFDFELVDDAGGHYFM